MAMTDNKAGFSFRGARGALESIRPNDAASGAARDALLALRPYASADHAIDFLRFAYKMHDRTDGQTAGAALRIVSLEVFRWAIDYQTTLTIEQQEDIINRYETHFDALAARFEQTRMLREQALRSRADAQRVLTCSRAPALLREFGFYAEIADLLR